MTTNQGGKNTSMVSSLNAYHDQPRSYHSLKTMQRKSNIRKFKMQFPEFSRLSAEKILRIFRFYKSNLCNKDFKIEDPSSIALGAIIIFIMRATINVGIARDIQVYSQIEFNTMTEIETFLNSVLAASSSCLTTALVQ